MRVVKVSAPEGKGADIVDLALAVGVHEASVRQEHSFRAGRQVETRDVVEVQTSAPNAKRYIEALTSAPFFDTNRYTFTLRDARAIVSSEPALELTRPFALPIVDVCYDLWQFNQVTISFVGRVAISGLLLAYGMIEAKLLLIVAGLLFLPLLPILLAIGFGVIEREWQLLARACIALGAAVGLLIAAGAIVALAMDAPIGFQDFGRLLPGFLVSLAVGVASSLATMDATGRRELIGLAAASQIALVPVWLGMRLVFGGAAADAVPPSERLLGLAVNTLTIVGVGMVTYLLCCAKSGGRASQRTSCFAIDSPREPGH
jgi:hypothetical protein